MKTKKGNESSLKEVLLNHLGVKDTDEINDWFRKSYDGGYPIEGFDRFKEIVDQYKEKEIHIIGDYDVDGVTATSIMYMGLKRYGCTNVFYRTPKRMSEGFGLNKTMIEEIPGNDILIITVDNGIAATDAVKYAKDRSFTVIVTDHHLPNYDDKGNVVLPEADLIIDPAALPNSAEYCGYCGAGIAYKLIKFLIGEEARYYYEALCAIGTIADVMELREENYVFVKNGLSGINKSPNLGIQALLSKLGKPERVSADFVGFQIGPCVNAPGRLIDDGSMRSVELFTAENKEDAERLAEFMYNQNKERKKLVEEASKKAIELIKAEGKEKDIPIVVSIPDVNEGIIGIIASKVMETFNRPAIVFTSIENDYLKGSARSPEKSFHMKNVLDRAKDAIYRYGGHSGAAGITIEEAKLEDFEKAVKESARAESYSPGTNGDVTYDIEISVAEAVEAAELIEQFSPHGAGNEKVVVKIGDFVNIPRNGIYKSPAGIEGIKLYGDGITAINFHAAEDFRDYAKPEKLTLYGDLNFNYFNGNRTCQINFSDFEVISTVNDTPNNAPFADVLATLASMRG